MNWALKKVIYGAKMGKNKYTVCGSTVIGVTGQKKAVENKEHDRNSTFWAGLVLFVPFVAIFFTLYREIYLKKANIFSVKNQDRASAFLIYIFSSPPFFIEKTKI